MSNSIQKKDIEALKAQIEAEIAARPQIRSSMPVIDVHALKAQVDAEIAARMQLEADSARYVHRRGFHAGGFRLLVGINDASEVVEMPALFRLPGAPSGVRGLANRNGRVVPVLDLSGLFGTQPGLSGKSWLLVCGHGDAAVGLVTESLPERKKFSPDEETGIPDAASPMAPYARAAYREGQDIWIDLDVEAFFHSIFQVEQSSI